MNPDMIKKALEALEKGDDAAAMEILKGMIVDAASDPDAEGDEAGAEGDGAEGVATPESVTTPEIVPASETAEEDDDENPKKKMARRALNTMLCRLTGTSNFAEALVQVQAYRASHLTLETERQALAAERATLESAERRNLCVELITLGAEFPGTVWADAASAKPGKLKTRWAKMPIVELRSHVADQRSARGAKKRPVAAVQPPAGEASADELDQHGLTAREAKLCEEYGCKPEDFVALRRTQAKGRRSATEQAAEVRAQTKKAQQVVSSGMRPKNFTEEGN